ncbi:MAG: T9SS type A sorting domain-containing protein [Flavobacteriales bacterium]|nr:T9SS type A sorting domain-containing protein [Flavobacteriales bacterium]
MLDGKLLVSGEMKFGSGLTYYLMRLNSDGSRDMGFPYVGAGGGKISTWSDRYYVSTAQTLRRLTPSGLLDNTFQHLNDYVEFSSGQGGDYHVYPDGSVVITGDHIVNVPDSGWAGFYSLIWFNNDGTLDLTRQPRQGNGSISLIVPQPDGKFLLSGPTTAWEGVPTPSIFRVHADGTLDTSFTCAMGWGEAASMTVLEDGRILVSGLFKTEFSSPDSLHFVRLMPDGSLDPGFNNDLEVVRIPWLSTEWPGNTINWGQFGLVGHTRISDGRIVVWGVHMVVEGQERRGLAMLDADGNLLDEPFGSGGCGRYYNEGTGYLYGDIGGILEAPDGFFYIWGGYKGYDDGTTNDPAQRFVSRLYGLNVGVSEQERIGFSIYPNPATGSATVQLAHMPERGVLTVRDALGHLLLQERVSSYTTTLDLGDVCAGVYLVELMDGSEKLASERLIVQP